jgi:hypothetical protein
MSPTEHKHVAAGLSLAFLAVLALADAIYSNALSIGSPPGFWNQGTIHLVLSGVSGMRLPLYFFLLFFFSFPFLPFSFCLKILRANSFQT